MHTGDEYVGGLDVVIDHRFREQKDEDEAAKRLEQSRAAVDAARVALAALADPAVTLIALRLAGQQNDPNGVKITDERIEMALTVLDRVGIPKLRATAIAASFAHAPNTPAPGSPGWVPPAVEDGDELALDKSSVDAQIDAFLDGAHVARSMKDGR